MIQITSENKDNIIIIINTLHWNLMKNDICDGKTVQILEILQID